MRSYHRLAFATVLLGALLAAPALASNNALHFDGVDDRVQLPLPTVFQSLTTQDVSFSAWIRPDGAPQSARIFFAQHNASEFATLLLSQGTTLVFYVRRGGTMFSAVASSPLPGGVWSHVAATWNAATSSPQIYVDGIELATLPGGSSSTGTDGVMSIGSRTDGAQAFPGTIDAARLWATTLTPSQVRVEALSRCGASAPRIAAYDFDIGVAGGDNAGLTGLPDVSGAGVHGTLVNFALSGQTSNWIESTLTLPAPALVFDPPLPSLLETDEAGAGYVGTVALAAPAASELTVTFNVDDTSEASASPTSIVFGPNTWNLPQPVSILGVDDAQFDGAVEFDVAIAASGDDCYADVALDVPGVSIDDESALIGATGTVQAEGDAAQDDVMFELTLDVEVPGGVSIAYVTADGSAIAGIDYVASSGSVQFSGTAGEVRQVLVPVLGNRDAQADRAFFLRLGPASAPGVTIAPTSVEAVIVDDDLDVSVELDDGVDAVAPGQSLTYLFVLENRSPTLSAAGVDATFSTSPPLQSLRWTCSGFGGASCASGSGADFVQTVVLPPEAVVIYALSGDVPAQHAGDVVANAAALPGDGIDSQPQDNVAVDVDFGPVMFADGFE